MSVKNSADFGLNVMSALAPFKTTTHGVSVPSRARIVTLFAEGAASATNFDSFPVFGDYD